MARKRMSDKRRKQLKRIRQFISRAEKRGYRFPEGFKESLPSLSTQKLKSFTAEKLYKNVATAISEKTGKIVKGSERRAEERSEAALKSARTRIEGKFAESIEGKLLQEQFEELDVPVHNPNDDINFLTSELISAGSVIMSNIYELIETFPSAGSEELRRMLNEELNTYGYDKVLFGLASAPQEAIKAVSEIVYYPSGGTTSAEAHRAFSKLGDIIKGTVRTSEEAKRLGDILDSMGYGEE